MGSLSIPEHSLPSRAMLCSVSISMWSARKHDPDASEEIAARATVERHARIGRGCYIGIGSVVGGDPQDKKYRGERTELTAGDDNIFRE